jgi:branched-chain amino acid transport system substrate-binding protein
MEANMLYILKNHRYGISLLLIAISIFLGCEKNPDLINIGVIAPLSGDAAAAGEMVKRGIDLAVDEINNSGGINGSTLNVIYEDSKGSPKDGVSAAQKLIKQDKVQVIIGGVFSSVALSISPIADKNKVVLLSPAASNPQLSTAGDYIFRVWPSDTFEGMKMAEIAYKNLNISEVGILHSSDDYGLGIKEVFINKYKKLGGNISIIENYHEGDTDFKTQITKIKSLMPRAIYLIGHYKEMSQILKQAKVLGIKSQFLSVSAFEVPEIIDLTGDAANGVIYLAPSYNSNSSTPEIKQFTTNFNKKYGNAPGIVEAHSYDALRIIASSMKRIKQVNGESIKNKLYQIKKYQGVTGEISFDENGDVSKPLQVKTLEKNKFVAY